jgi:hypothetical protein
MVSVVSLLDDLVLHTEVVPQLRRDSTALAGE